MERFASDYNPRYGTVIRDRRKVFDDVHVYDTALAEVVVALLNSVEGVALLDARRVNSGRTAKPTTIDEILSAARVPAPIGIQYRVGRRPQAPRRV